MLLFNAHLSDKQNRPDRVPRGRVGAAGRLRQAAVPHVERAAAAAAGGGQGRPFPGGPKSRGFVFNADLVAVIRFLDIGTRVAQAVR